MSSSIIMVSSCLVGLCCRYDGKRIFSTKVQEIVAKGKGILICPEQLGGLPTPRVPSQIISGNGFDVLSGKARVISENGLDVTEKFLIGANETLRMAKLIGLKKIIFKERSPSCGVRNIYYERQIVDGCGVTTAILLKNGFEVVSDEE